MKYETLLEYLFGNADRTIYVTRRMYENVADLITKEYKNICKTSYETAKKTIGKEYIDMFELPSNKSIELMGGGNPIEVNILKFNMMNRNCFNDESFVNRFDDLTVHLFNALEKYGLHRYIIIYMGDEDDGGPFNLYLPIEVKEKWED